MTIPLYDHELLRRLVDKVDVFLRTKTQIGPLGHDIESAVSRTDWLNAGDHFGLCGDGDVSRRDGEPHPRPPNELPGAKAGHGPVNLCAGRAESVQVL